MAQDLKLGAIIRRNTVGRTRYIVINAGLQHEPTEEDYKRGYSIADRCTFCDAIRIKSNGKYKFIQSFMQSIIM